jgi:hypothetical protein
MDEIFKKKLLVVVHLSNENIRQTPYVLLLFHVAGNRFDIALLFSLTMGWLFISTHDYHVVNDNDNL